MHQRPPSFTGATEESHQHSKPAMEGQKHTKLAVQCWEAASAKGLEEEHEQLQWVTSHHTVWPISSMQAHRRGSLAASNDFRRLARTLRQLPGAGGGGQVTK